MAGNKTSYSDIFIYTIVVVGIMLFYRKGIISYHLMETLLVAALAVFALYNMRFKIKKLFTKNHK